ncbi:hypothetical protein [Acrocarpospora sp. B8E8]|uniref:hypothetical protein n=1 Tax=Acrocarpospora sp. B8E8 TaxID=3153572 RepID=UPI00325DE57C
MSPSQPVLPMASVALAPAAVLRMLARAAGQSGLGEDDLPVVRVGLSNGQVVAGRLVLVGTDDGHEVVVLAPDSGFALTYLSARDVVTVTVDDPRPFQDVLTGGALPPPATDSPVTRLSLRRGYAPTEEFPLQVDWEALPDSALHNLSQVLRELRAAAQEVAVDELGRQAWAQIRAVRVEHRLREPLSMRKDADVLLVVADLTAALPRGMGVELRRQFNILL